MKPDIHTILSLIAGLVAICIDRWTDDNEWMFYFGALIIIVEIGRLTMAFVRDRRSSGVITQ